jgi:hypothetical protein
MILSVGPPKNCCLHCIVRGDRFACQFCIPTSDSSYMEVLHGGNFPGLHVLVSISVDFWASRTRRKYILVDIMILSEYLTSPQSTEVSTDAVQKSHGIGSCVHPTSTNGRASNSIPVQDGMYNTVLMFCGRQNPPCR